MYKRQTHYHDNLFSARTEVSTAAELSAVAHVAHVAHAAAVDPMEERARVALAAASAAIDAMMGDDWPAVS